MFVPLHHRVRKGARLSPSLLFVVVMQAESLGTRLIQEYTDACPNSLTVQMLIHIVNVTEQQLHALGVLKFLSCTHGTSQLHHTCSSGFIRIHSVIFNQTEVWSY